MTHHESPRRLLLLAAVSAPLAARAFEFSVGKQLKGSGTVVEHAQELPAFDAIDVRDGIALTLQQSQTPRLVLHTDDNLVPLFEAEVKDRTLVLRRRDSMRPTRWQLTVNVWKLDALELGGGTSASAETLVAKQLRIELAGGASAHFDHLTAESLTLKLDGGANLRAAGQANEIDAAVAGGGVLDLRALRARRVTAQVKGGASVRVWATDNLDGRVAGGGVLRYRGEPRVSVSKGSGGSVGTL